MSKLTRITDFVSGMLKSYVRNSLNVRYMRQNALINILAKNKTFSLIMDNLSVIKVSR